MNRLADHQGIHKFFAMLGLALYFSKPVMKHLVHIIDALITKGFFWNIDRSSPLELSSQPSHDTKLFFHEKPLG